jgi:rhodanese-related sulfurtransferase
MDLKEHVLEAATLIVAAIVCALVANAFASRERKVAVVPQPVSVAAGVPPASERPGAAAPTQTAATPTSITTIGQPDNSTTRQPAKRQPTTDNRQPIDRFKPHPDKPYVEIHGDDVAWLHSKGVLFLDARRTSVYEQGHIPGARPFSVWESDIDDKVRKLFDERSDSRDQEKPIVIYCSGGDCEDSHMLAQKLWGIQFNNIYVYKDGFPDWERRREPTHSGPNP